MRSRPLVTFKMEYSLHPRGTRNCRFNSNKTNPPKIRSIKFVEIMNTNYAT